MPRRQKNYDFLPIYTIPVLQKEKKNILRRLHFALSGGIMLKREKSVFAATEKTMTIRNSSIVQLADVERRTAGEPGVLAILDAVKHPLPRQQRYMRAVQLCLRLDGEPAEYRVEVDGVIHRAGYPHLLIKRAGNVLRHDAPGWCNAFCITCAAKDLPRELQPVVLAELAGSPELAAALRRVRELLGRSREFGVADRLDRRCAELILEIQLAIARRREPPRAENEMIRRAVSYLQLHFMEQIDYEALARKFGCSPRSFHRHWRRVCGNSPAAFVGELRFAEAKRMLTETGYSLAEIALRLHYSEVSNFCSAFKHRFGITPRQCRMQQ